MAHFELIKPMPQGKISITTVSEEHVRKLLSDGWVRDVGHAVERLKANPFGQTRVGDGQYVRWNNKETE